MSKKLHIGLGVLLLAVPLIFAACGDDDDVVTTTPPVVAPPAALWVVPDNTFADNVATVFTAAPDNLYYNVHSAAHTAGEIRGQLDTSGVVRLAALNGIQEVIQGDTGGFGAGALIVDNVLNQVRGFVITSRLAGTPNAAHIHNAARGFQGPIILTLTGGPDFWVVPDNVSQAAMDNVIAVYNAAPDNLYFNVHTTMFSNGAIRGQLDVEGPTRVATLNGAQDNTTSTFLGAGMMVLDNTPSLLPATDNQVRGFIYTAGLSGNTAHIHNAARGTAGGIIVALEGGPNLWIVPDRRISGQLVGIFNAAPDNLYYNVHTAAFSNGEIRGQLDANGTFLFATLNGAQETPSVTTSAFGAGVASVNVTDNAVRGFILTSGMTGTVAHIHGSAVTGGRGTSAPPILGLLPAP